MTDNTNIEAEEKQCRAACEDQGMPWSSAIFSGWLVCRAALSNAAPVAYGTLLQGGKLHAMRNTKEDADRRTSAWNTRMPQQYEAVTVPLFLHPIVLAPLTPGRIYLIVSDRVFNTLGRAVVTDLVRTIEKEHGIGLPLTNTEEQG